MPFDPCARFGQPPPGQSTSGTIKGQPIRVFDRQATARLSDVAVDCQQFNAVNVEVTVSGTNPSATLILRGASAQGNAIFLPLSDPNAIQTITANVSFDCVVGTAWLRAELADVSGTYAAGQGYTVTITPYVSPGQTRVTVTVGTEPSGDGTYATSTASGVDVGTTSTMVLASNASRRYASFVNDSDTDVYLAIGVDAAVHAGILLKSRGGSYEMDQKLGNLSTAAITAIHAGTGTKRLVVTEGV